MCCANPVVRAKAWLHPAPSVESLLRRTRKNAKSTCSGELKRYLPCFFFVVLLSALANYSLLSWLRSFLYDTFLIEDLGVVVLLWSLWMLVSRSTHGTSRSGVPNQTDRGKDTDSSEADDAYEDAVLDNITPQHPSGGSTRCGDRCRLRRTLRRRLHHRALEQLHGVVSSIYCTEATCRNITQVLPKVRRSGRGAANFHIDLGPGNLLPVEVAACQYAPDVSEHLRWLLEDRWDIVKSGLGDNWLASIPE